jgi:hypothetical protein
MQRRLAVRNIVCSRWSDHRRGQVPSLKQLGYSDEEMALGTQDDPRSVLPFMGGEDAALARVKHYIWDKDCLKARPLFARENLHARGNLCARRRRAVPLLAACISRASD